MRKRFVLSSLLDTPQAAKAEKIAQHRQLIDLKIAQIRSPANPDKFDKWERYFGQWKYFTTRAIKETLTLYLEAKGRGHPHIRWLEQVGFRFGRNPQDVVVPAFPDILVHYLEGMHSLVRGGFPADRLIYPARVLYNRQTRHFIYREFGAEIPPGYEGTTHLIPFPLHLEMLKKGIFGMGEPTGLGTPAIRPYVSFLMHDLAHLSLYQQIPELMPAFQEAGRSLEAAQVDLPPMIRGWPNTPFRTEQVAVLAQAGILPEDASESALNLLPEEDRLPLHTAYVELTRPLTEGQLAAVRYRLVLESGSLLPRRAAEAFRRRMTAKGWIPRRSGSHLYTAAEIESHLQTKSDQSIAEFNSELVREFPRLVRIYGGATQDIAQNEVRFRAAGPTGNSHFATMDYLWFRAREFSADAGYKRQAAALNAAKLAAAMIASGDVNAFDWIRTIGEKPARDSALYRWLCGTGSFIQDDYWRAYCL